MQSKKFDWIFQALQRGVREGSVVLPKLDRDLLIDAMSHLDLRLNSTMKELPPAPTSSLSSSSSFSSASSVSDLASPSTNADMSADLYSILPADSSSTRPQISTYPLQIRARHSRSKGSKKLEGFVHRSGTGSVLGAAIPNAQAFHVKFGVPFTDRRVSPQERCVIRELFRSFHRVQPEIAVEAAVTRVQHHHCLKWYPFFLLCADLVSLWVCRMFPDSWALAVPCRGCRQHQRRVYQGLVAPAHARDDPSCRW